MKKIILLLTVLTLGVIACDKNELGDMDSMSINPIEATVEVNSMDPILDYLLANIETMSSGKLGNASSTAKGNDYLAVTIFSEDGFTYLVLVDDSNDDLCFGEKSVNTVYWNNINNDGSVLSIEDLDGNVIRNINGSFASLFSSAYNTTIKLTLTSTDLTIEGSGDFDADNFVTIN